jgi:hypothetical protein
MMRLNYMWDMFWYRAAAFCSRRISQQGKMAIIMTTERQRAEEEHRVIH